MSTYYPTTADNYSLIRKNSINTDEKKKISNEALVDHVAQLWKLKTVEKHDSINNHCSQLYTDQISSNNNTIVNMSYNILSNYTDKNDDELSTNNNESKTAIPSIKKQVTPLSSSNRRQRLNVKNQSISNDSSNNNIPIANNQNKSRGTTKRVKKSFKSGPIFIAPKKFTPQTHTSSKISFDESLQIKQKPILKRQSTLTDDCKISTVTTTTTQPSPIRFCVQSSGSSLDNDDDDDSSDEDEDESLKIRQKYSTMREKQIHSNTVNRSGIPYVILITDPHGNSRVFDPDNYQQENCSHDDEDLDDNDSDENNINSLRPNTVYDISSTPEILINSINSPNEIHDRHQLHSIGEEEEEEEQNENIERSDQTNNNQNEREQVNRRWSDSFIDEDDEQNSSPLTKMASATCISKQTDNPPAKLSKTKYLLMKLHLTTSNKDNESNSSSPPKPTRKRTVHRSTDKKRYQTQ